MMHEGMVVVVVVVVSDPVAGTPSSYALTCRHTNPFASIYACLQPSSPPCHVESFETLSSNASLTDDTQPTSNALPMEPYIQGSISMVYMMEMQRYTMHKDAY